MSDTGQAKKKEKRIINQNRFRLEDKLIFMQHCEQRLKKGGDGADFIAHTNGHTPDLPPASHIPIPQGPLTGEDLKAALVSVDTNRSLDALVGVRESPWQTLAEKATVGPFERDILRSPEISGFVGDPTQVIIIACGRNEHQRGNLVPTLTYIQESGVTALYVDANSTDGSDKVAWNRGVETVSRRDVLGDMVDRKALAEILGIPISVLEGKDVEGYPPLRKGMEVMSARIALLKKMLDGNAPRYALWLDTDLKSIPHGSIAYGLLAEQVYYPIQLAAAGLLSLRGQNGNPWAVYTGSENRNNEPIFAAHNMIAARGASRRLDARQKDIARALGHFPGLLVHPLTGELVTSTEFELNAMNATGQCTETARNLSLAGAMFAVHNTTNPETLQDLPPLIGNVRRGTQQRVDEPQTPEKEWWMIGSVLPAFMTIVSEHCIAEEKLPHELTLDDYAALNQELAEIHIGSQLDGPRQTRRYDQFPMERAIPPVALLYKEGMLKL